MPAERAEEEFPDERGAKVVVAGVPVIDGGGERVAASGMSATGDANIDFRRSWLQSSLKLDCIIEDKRKSIRQMFQSITHNTRLSPSSSLQSSSLSQLFSPGM
jgi:hypothetical protein